MSSRVTPVTHPIARVAAILAWMAIIFAVSSRQSVPAPAGNATSILGHFTVYFVLAIVVWWALGIFSLGAMARVALAWALAVLYGVTDEWHQSFVPGRTPDIKDILVDGIGAAVGLLAIWWVTSRRWRTASA